MISGKRRVLVLAGAALVGGSVIGARLLSGSAPKPVDARQVQSSFGPEPVLSATYTTSVLGVGPTTTPPPPPPVTTAQAHTADPKPTGRVREPAPTRKQPPWLEGLGGCDDDYRTDGTCV